MKAISSIRCSRCGFLVDDPMALRCPRCWHELIRIAGCTGHCKGCRKPCLPGRKEETGDKSAKSSRVT